MNSGHFKHFANLSIKRKLVTISMVTVTVALVLAGSAFTLYELHSFRRAAMQEFSTIAQMVGENATAALAFDDPKAARETLTSLRAESRIVRAAIYSKDGSIFARYSKSGETEAVPAQPESDGVRFTPSDFFLFQTILMDGERVGTVYLQCELTELESRLRQYAGIVLVVLLLSGMAALAISAKLQRVISQPLRDLTETASRVSADQNYSRRAARSSADELGVLVDRFNEMMAQIQSRDQALQQAQDDLERRVEVRTRELQNEIGERRRVQEDLLAAKQAAEESSRAKSAFLANMSHELRTPLNAIIGYSEMLQEMAADQTPEERSADLAKIQQAGRHLLTLINDVLDISKIEAGKMELHLQPVAIADMMAEVAATIEPLARRNNNLFQVENQEPEGFMLADAVRFRQSLLNLLSNACKFTEAGVVGLKVRRQSEGGLDWVLWEVADTGIGIAASDIGKLFRSFSQVDNSSTRKYEGTGLGLSISDKLCSLMGGSITVESEVGRGSRFTIRMPGLRMDPSPADSGRNRPAECEHPLTEEEAIHG